MSLTFNTAQNLADHLEAQMSTGDADVDYILRDNHERPWLVTFDDGGDPFVTSYPQEDEHGHREDLGKHHGSLNLPVYPIRIVKES